jgi:3-phosphoshikimate 1-carboxyvinyltransferase
VQEPWPAPTATAPIGAVVAVPASKSVTNRALVLAALSETPSTVRNPLRARDTLLMSDALRALGVSVADADDGSWLVRPAALRGPARVDVGLAGTVMRFVPPVAALAAGPVSFDGDPHARNRPLAPLVDGLRQLGASLNSATGGLPLTVHGTGRLRGGEAKVDASGSSQFVSGLLLAAPQYDEGMRLRHVGPPMPSALQVAMTVQMLRAAGATVDAEPNGLEWTVKPGPVTAGELTVPSDLSSATPFAAAALVTAGRVRIPNWPRRSLQPGDRLPDLLAQMGARCRFDGDDLLVSGGDHIDGLDADLADASELVPVLAVLAALARTPSVLRGIAHMRGHETDRLAALAGELTALGGDVAETPDGLRIAPRPLQGGVFHTHADHRLAMAAAVLGLAVPGVLVEDVATTAKTVPDFLARWQAMLS